MLLIGTANLANRRNPSKELTRVNAEVISSDSTCVKNGEIHLEPHFGGTFTSPKWAARMVQIHVLMARFVSMRPRLEAVCWGREVLYSIFFSQKVASNQGLIKTNLSPWKLHTVFHPKATWQWHSFGDPDPLLTLVSSKISPFSAPLIIAIRARRAINRDGEFGRPQQCFEGAHQG